MKSKKLIFAVLTCLTSGIISGFPQVEVRHAWVFFNKKDNLPIDQYQYFEPRSLEQKIHHGIEPYDYFDLPVSKDYLEALKEHCIEIPGSSRWLNAALVSANNEQLKIIEGLSFVESLAYYEDLTCVFAKQENIENDDPPGLAKAQLEIHEAALLRENNLDGEGIMIAVFDGGFPGVDTNPAFSHLWRNKRIAGTWDFAYDNPQVYKYNSHGTEVLSCICGILDGTSTGMAPEASFLLARTELSGEPWKEELYWIQAAEWADRMGAQIISSSLGYTYHRYFVRDMTGRDTPVARAANIAAKKGILVINCMGNEGDNKWKYAVTPADADSVLSVGGVDPVTQTHMNFSSHGPNMSGGIKPNVVASGIAYVASDGQWKKVFGTSFSAPLVAGFAACAWQLYPDFSNMEIFDLIQKAGHLYPYYDFVHGFGIPKASKLLSLSLQENPPKANNIKVTSDKGALIVEVGKEEFLKAEIPHYLYYNLRDSENNILRYGVYRIQPGVPVNIKINKDENIRSCYLRTDSSFEIIKLQP